MRQVLLQQLHMDVERTEWIANLVRQTGQQAREQKLFLLRRQLAHVLTQRSCQDFFHRDTKDARDAASNPDLFAIRPPIFKLE